MISAKQNEFIRLYAISGKSLDTISQEIEEEKSSLVKWEKQFKKEIIDVKAEEFDKILENSNVSDLSRFNYLCEIYSRLKKELDKRDFSGLQTDKLFYMLDDVYDLIQSIKNNDVENK